MGLDDFSRHLAVVLAFSLSRGGTMFNLKIAILSVAVLGTLTAITCSAQKSKLEDRSSSMVLIFKDGHQKSFSASDVARIEFNPPHIVLKNGHQETFSADALLRIEMNSSASDNGVLGRNHFVGKWKVGTGAGSDFYITLEPDGDATKTIGAGHGTWTLVNGEARVSWDDGWHDAIRKVGSKHEKFAYEPGKSFDDEPSNVTDAKNMNAQPI
jgi:hypothetical protein